MVARRKAPKKEAASEHKGKRTWLVRMEKSQLPRFLPFCLFVVLTVLLFRDFIFGPGFLFGTDTLEAGIMFRSFYADFVRSHHALPLWNPYLFGGLPFIDAMHGDTFYPLAFLQFFLPLEKALGYKLVITVLLAGLFTYLLLRGLGLSQLVSAFGGGVYQLSAVLVSAVYGGHDGRMYVTSLLPLLLFSLDRAWKKKKAVDYLLFAFVFALLVYANHPQFAYFATWLTGVYFLFQLALGLASDKKWLPTLRHLLLFVIALLIGLSGSLIQILPQYVYLKQHSPRSEEGRGYEFASSWSLHPEEVVDQVVPGFSGYNVWREQTYWGRNAFKLNSEYGGIIPLAFAIMALFVIKDRRKYLFLGVSLVALFYALGDNTPFFKLFYYLVPGVKNFRAPSTIMFLFTFSVTVLGAMGLERLTGGIGKKTQAKMVKGLLVSTIAFAAITLLLALTHGGLLSLWNSILYPSISAEKLEIQKGCSSEIIIGFLITTALLALVTVLYDLHRKKVLGRSVFIGSMIVLAVLDLWRVDARFIRVVPLEEFFRKDAAIEFLQRQAAREPFRVLVSSGVYHDQDHLAYFGIPQLFGYHGNQLKIYDDFTDRPLFEKAESAEEYQRLTLQLLMGPKVDLLAVKYLLTPYEFQSMKYKAVRDFGRFKIYENLNALPRVRLVNRYEVIPDPEQALKRVAAASFNYRESVILEKAPPFPSAKETVLKGRASIVQDKINELSIEAELDSPGILLLADNYYPAWRGYVDEEPVQIVRANYIHRAIFLAPGRHRILFRFESHLYRTSLYVSLLTITALVLIILAVRLRDRLSSGGRASG